MKNDQRAAMVSSLANWAGLLSTPAFAGVYHSAYTTASGLSTAASSAVVPVDQWSPFIQRVGSRWSYGSCPKQAFSAIWAIVEARQSAEKPWASRSADAATVAVDAVKF